MEERSGHLWVGIQAPKNSITGDGSRSSSRPRHSPASLARVIDGKSAPLIQGRRPHRMFTEERAILCVNVTQERLEHHQGPDCGAMAGGPGFVLLHTRIQ